MAKHFETTEYLLAAALRAAGCEFVGAAPGQGRVILRFADPGGQATKAARDHENGRLVVRSDAMANAIDQMKNSIFAARRSAGLHPKAGPQLPGPLTAATRRTSGQRQTAAFRNSDMGRQSQNERSCD